MKDLLLVASGTIFVSSGEVEVFFRVRGGDVYVNRENGMGWKLSNRISVNMIVSMLEYEEVEVADERFYASKQSFTDLSTSTDNSDNFEPFHVSEVVDARGRSFNPE